MPLLSERKLVADLDRVMAVEKPLLATWDRIPGWSTDAEARAFALALSRKRLRFALPDDFTALVRKLQSRLADKHEKNSDEGRGLRALDESILKLPLRGTHFSPTFSSGSSAKKVTQILKVGTGRNFSRSGSNLCRPRAGSKPSKAKS